MRENDEEETCLENYSSGVCRDSYTRDGHYEKTVERKRGNAFCRENGCRNQSGKFA